MSLTGGTKRKTIGIAIATSLACLSAGAWAVDGGPEAEPDNQACLDCHGKHCIWIIYVVLIPARLRRNQSQEQYHSIRAAYAIEAGSAEEWYTVFHPAEYPLDTSFLTGVLTKREARHRFEDAALEAQHPPGHPLDFSDSIANIGHG